MRRIVIPLLIGACLGALSCSNQPAPPQKGTPAFYWQAAKETYAAGDYMKTLDHLRKLTAEESEYKAKAQPWLLVMTSGMAGGYMYLADAYEVGARARKSDPAAYRKLVSQYRGAAGRLALQYAQEFNTFKTAAPEKIAIAFPFPRGSAGPVAILTKAAAGQPMTVEEIERAQKQGLERGVVQELCRVVGAPDDAAKAGEMFKSGEPSIDRKVLMGAMAASLYEQAQLFSRNRLDEPAKQKIFSTQALEALKLAPDYKDAKELQKKIDVSLKQIK